MSEGTLRKIRCVAVDDEPIGLSVIAAHAAKVPYLDLQGTFTSATEALAYLQRHPLDLVFLDIEMPDLSGLEVARLIGTQARIIFTTAYPHYAVEGFELAATDYLLKPIGLSRFLQACGRVSEQLEAAGRYLFVKDGYDWVRVDLAALRYLKADDNYLTFYETHQTTLTRMTLTEALQRLPAERFVRVHKSYVVSLDFVEKIERHQLTVAGVKVPWSATYREELLRRIG
ncbi:LytTR family DNA-binding domain-containing protein [Rhabdobacter roseus]|uniref:DNA-binding LytR/AlgR family response regulator n=1 Tax=Rhabdobacter roseus TaxID=1655419 RepID=A0A840TIV4_9BACT|nr:DNA-binding LytR/AlgR family response regulator [Rhabdobacter roseus]